MTPDEVRKIVEEALATERSRIAGILRDAKVVRERECDADGYPRDGGQDTSAMLIAIACDIEQHPICRHCGHCMECAFNMFCVRGKSHEAMFR